MCTCVNIKCKKYIRYNEISVTCNVTGRFHGDDPVAYEILYKLTKHDYTRKLLILLNKTLLIPLAFR
jgi:hypothetical protein